MKILVLGAGGMAGHMLAVRLAELGHDVVCLAREKLRFCGSIVADVCNVEKLNSIVCGANYDAVVNAIGSLPQDINKNPASGIWLNAYLPHLLSCLTFDSKTKLIHLSTDCVFSGRDSGNYNECSFRSADDYYGRSKSIGEVIDNNNLTFRMSIIGPDINENGVGLFNWFMKQNGEVFGYRRAIWSGVTTLALADAVDAALEQNISGLYHLVNNDKINKYELLRLFNTLRNEPVLIKATDDYIADKSMINTRTDFDFEVPSYEEMIVDMGKWIAGHKGLYPHYNLGGLLDNEKIETDDNSWNTSGNYPLI